MPEAVQERRPSLQASRTGAKPSAALLFLPWGQVAQARPVTRKDRRDAPRAVACVDHLQHAVAICDADRLAGLCSAIAVLIALQSNYLTLDAAIAAIAAIAAGAASAAGAGDGKLRAFGAARRRFVRGMGRGRSMAPHRPQIATSR